MTRGFGRFLRRNTIALLALFLALGGTSAFAAATLINGSQIKPHTIAKNRLTNKAVKQLKGNRGARGPQGAAGPAGPTGAQGIQGIQGPAGPVRLRYLQTLNIANPANTQNFGSATCPAGEYVTGGGAFGSFGGVTQSVNSSFPFKNPSTVAAPNAWGVWMNNADAAAHTFNVYAVCAPPSSVISFGPTHQAAK
jgi:hypothetical protein